MRQRYASVRLRKGVLRSPLDRHNNDSRIETAGRKFTLPERPNTGGGQGLSYVDAEESVNLISS